MSSPPTLSGLAPRAIFAEGGAAPVTLSPSVTVTDPDSTDLVGATVTISGGFSGDGDVLAAVSLAAVGTNSALVANYDSSTETLILSGTNTLANYELVLDTVTFFSNAADPTEGGVHPTRSVSWTLNDGASSSQGRAPTETVFFVTPPAIAQSAAEGDTLTVTGGTADPSAAVTYQWQRDGVNIAGATASTYLVQEVDETHHLTAVVISQDSDGSGTSITSNATSAVTDIAPTLTPVTIPGTAVAGTFLTATGGVPNDSDHTVSYQWQSNGTNISGATDSTYMVQASDETHQVQVVVTSKKAQKGSAPRPPAMPHPR